MPSRTVAALALPPPSPPPIGTRLVETKANPSPGRPQRARNPRRRAPGEIRGVGGQSLRRPATSSSHAAGVRRRSRDRPPGRSSGRWSAGRGSRLPAAAAPPGAGSPSRSYGISFSGQTISRNPSSGVPERSAASCEEVLGRPVARPRKRNPEDSGRWFAIAPESTGGGPTRGTPLPGLGTRRRARRPARGSNSPSDPPRRSPVIPFVSRSRRRRALPRGRSREAIPR